MNMQLDLTGLSFDDITQRITGLDSRVFIYLTSYNHEKYIANAIESVLRQSYEDFHLFIWDDASSDASWDIIRKYSDPRIITYREPINTLGGVDRFDQVIRCLHQDCIVAIHHSDDEWVKGKLEKQLMILHNQVGVDVVFSLVQPIDDMGADFIDRDHVYFNIFEQPNRNRYQWLRFFFLNGNALCHPSALIRKSAFAKHGTYKKCLFQLPDFDFWIRICLSAEIFVVQERLTRFRVRENNLNVSGLANESQVRCFFELYQVLRNYLAINDYSLLESIFPEVSSYYSPTYTNISYLFARLCLDLKPFRVTELLGLDILYGLLQEKVIADALEAHYGFDYASFVKLSGNHDPFGLVYINESSRK